MVILSTCEELCENILGGVQVGEFAEVQPLSVEYSCILGYLLAWKLLLTFFKSSPSHVSPDQSLDSCLILVGLGGGFCEKINVGFQVLWLY